MDPYRALGVARDSTRDQVKAAFRARVPSTHPDRGGENADFVALRAAYERILAILDRREARKLANNQPERPKNADPDVATSVSPSGNTGQSQQGDPARVERTKKRREPTRYQPAYLDWLQRVSADAARRDPRRRWKWVRRLGVSYLLLMICWFAVGAFSSFAASIYESNQRPHRDDQHLRYQEQPREPEVGPGLAEIVSVAALCHSPLLAIFIIVCKFDDYHSH
jgi:curved DNA-binding protein CbpA